MDKDSTAIQKKITAEVEQFKSAQKEFSKLVQQRQLLDGQLNENKSVLDELNLLGADNKVYKLFGPVLVKQELEESRQNVAKRMEYIKKELKRCNETIETLEKRQDKHRENLQKLQQQFQVSVAMK
ncbi:probable prefoldin subunit 6 [Bradysia coprophila]|uniref:probable prefoldin subunit 6 n=1 Tax=Bradysia coprophila TaxID=38358 RepID=UPI00187D841D|nr:probable prefoldin subunit 6 [Bradysia coprophila]